ncbi:hypothetical protein EV204_101310 [Tissierella praeacuta]|uniref:hypothetical protein n=1 Tax=Tissierella praeacuta TaxID=43131 RepID=UPI0010EDAAF7|nr:hypothetical protein [Tissierella praeacuta]TCU79331.1 hypothetical protein EV204_101310 [Tissierella praeacuta]
MIIGEERGEGGAKPYSISINIIKDKGSRIEIMKYVIVSLIVCITIITIVAIMSIVKRK